jgi:hypothetical protein
MRIVGEEMNMRIAVTIILPILTLWWAHGVYRHFIRRPKDAGCDWGMTHGMHLGIGSAALIGLWLGAWKDFLSGLAQVFK